MDKKVYIVHCIDAEGPLYESIEATFQRIKDIYGYDIYPSKENLEKLQLLKIDLGGKEKAVANLVAPERINMNDTWDKIDYMLDKITQDEFRNRLVDSSGRGWIYNWFCLDHVGFTGYNPRRRDAGYHNIFDHYKKYLNIKNNYNDIIQWHYHPIPLSGHYHACGTAYVASKNVFEILARKIIDRNWFPAAFRPGFHTERPDSHWFLEQWIPFDFANQAVKGLDTDQPDLAGGRYGDWRRAPKEWCIYHPSYEDYQTPGNCKRWIVRCLNMEARLREITIDDFRDGFSRARQEKPTLISFTNHDFRDMELEINKVRNMIKKVKEEYPDVEFFYANAIDAVRKVLGLTPKIPEMQLEFKKNLQKNEAILEVRVKNDIFGVQPFLAIKTVTEQYYWDNLDFQEQKHWTYTFDWNTVKLNSLEKVGIGVNSPDGVTEVLVYDVLTEQLERTLYNV